MMTDSVIHPDSADEQKRNRNLAIWLGVGLVGAFMLLYFAFFLITFLRPGLMFRFIPMPTITQSAVSDGSRIYLMQQKMDFSSMETKGEDEPRMQEFLTVLNGSEPGESREISSYDHASGSGGRLLLVSKGEYRIFDGSRWTEEKSEAIGSEPVGLLTPAGVYVISEHDDGPHLNLMAKGAVVDVPLPPEYLEWYRSESCPCNCARLAWYQGRLCFFWKGNNALSWTMQDGDGWSPAATSPYSGGYDVLADGENLYIFQREGEGAERHLSSTVLSNGEWQGPTVLPITGEFMDWDVFVHKGKVKLFVQQMSHQTISTLEKGRLLHPVQLEGPFNFASTMGKGWLAMSAVSTALSFLVVLGVAAVIRRFKRRIWHQEGTEYEFAGLFRRFAAMMIDNVILLILPGLLVVGLLADMDQLMTDPFRAMARIFSAVFLFFVGGFLYHSLLEGIYGRTIGKRLCGIRVLKADFSRCSLGAAFIRNLLRIADAFFYYLVAVVTLAATMKWQRVGDLVADTVVVRERKG